MTECEDLFVKDSDKAKNTSTFLWVIKDVIKFPIQLCNSKAIFCKFSVNHCFESTWCILLGNKYSGIDLELRLEKCSVPVFASVSIGVLDHEFNTQFEVTKSCHSLSVSGSFCLMKFVSQHLLIEKKETLLHNGDLILIGKLTVFNNEIYHSVHCIPCYSHFSRNMETLLEDVDFSDFSISVQDKQFRCHKVVLAARSKYFETLFNNSLQENEAQELAVTDSEADVIEQILNYIYTNTIDITPSNIVPILYAAEQYILHDLKQICESKMHSFFSFGNCDELFEVANLYNLPAIKIRAIHMRMLFTNQFEARCMFPALKYSESEESTDDDSETSYEGSLDGLSNANSHIELDKQEPFLPYADLWIATNRRAVFEHTWKINSFVGGSHSGDSMTRIFSDDVYKASYKMEFDTRTYYASELIFSELSLNFTILSSQAANSRMEFYTRAVNDSGYLVEATPFIDDIEVGEKTTVFTVNNEKEAFYDKKRHSKARFHPRAEISISCKCWSPSWMCYHHKLPELRDNLIDDVSSTYTSHKFSDLTIKVGSSEFQCHKAMMSCRSRFFAQMLEERKNEMTITLDDIDEKAFEKILRYIYMDRYDSVEADAWELLPFASKYELEHLKVMCEKHLIASLSLETVVESLQLSIAHSAPTLQKYALRYIGDNFSDIFARPDAVDQMMMYNITELFTNTRCVPEDEN